jgi:hypothetical protein
MLPAFKAFVGGPLGDGRQWLPWIHADDVVRALLFAVDDACIEGAFNVSAPEPVRMDEFARVLGKVLRRPSFMRVPEAALRVALGAGLARTVTTGQRVVPRKLLDCGFEFRFRDLEGALRDLV